MRVLGVSASAFGATVTLGATLAAAPGVRIEYSAGDGCPTAAQFRQAVHDRAPELTDAPEGEPAREFVVNTERREEHAFGSVVISDPSGATVTRRLDGNRCTEVADALAFIVAELGNTARLESEAASTPPARPALAAASKPHLASQTAAKGNDSPASVPTARRHWEAGVGLESVRAPAPDWVLAPLVYAELLLARDRSVSFTSARLSLSYGKSGTIRGTIGDAEIRWFVGRTELCGWLVGENPVLGACGTVELGVIAGRGGGGAEAPKVQSALWLAPGVSLRGTNTLEHTLVFGLEAGAFFPLVRPRFYFANGEDEADSETIHEVPALGFRAQASLGVRFP